MFGVMGVVYVQMDMNALVCAHVDTYGGQRLILSFFYHSDYNFFNAGSHSEPGASLLAGLAGQ